MTYKDAEKIYIELIGTGIQGPKGDKGDKGDKGETGPQGPQGQKGEKGDPGSNMPQQWVDEITTSVGQFKIDIKSLQQKDEEIALTFEEVFEIIRDLKVEDIEETTLNVILNKLNEKIKSTESAIFEHSNRLSDLETNGVGGSDVEEIIITDKDTEGLTAKVIIKEDEEYSTMCYNANGTQKNINILADDVYIKETSDDDIETITQLTKFLKDNKEEIKLLKALIGDLSELSTDNKQNLMEAVNELAAISRNAVSRLEFDKIENKMKVFNHHGLVDELDMDTSYLEN